MWNDNWGTMIWGSSAPVPSLPLLGLLLLAVTLAGLGMWRLRSRRGQPWLGALWALPVLVFLAGGLAWAQVISVPFTFTNGTRADALQVNQNFQSLLTAANSDRTLIKSGRAVVMESEFRANRPTAQVLFGLNGGGAFITNGATEPFISSLVAPTHAPAGARLTRVDIFVTDLDPTLNISACIFSYDNVTPGAYGVLGCTTTSGTPGASTISLDLTGTAAQSDRFYELRLSAVNGSTGAAWPGNTLLGRGAVVTYQFD